MIIVNSIPWQPIADIPDALKDGRPILLWCGGAYFEPTHNPAWVGAYDHEESSGAPWGWADYRENGVRLTPTHFAEINPPG